MKFGLIPRLEKMLVFLLLGSFALPLILSGVVLIPAMQTPATAWLRNANLGGVQVQPNSVFLSRASLLSAKYQEALAKRYNFSFAGREFMIRLADEFYLRVFHTSPVGIVIGPHLALNGVDYVREYCQLRYRKDLLAPLVDDLRRLQDFCDGHHIAFAFLITPSKAAVLPETLPANWLRRYVSQPREYDHLLPLLREKGVRYVDGHRITADLKRTAKAPVFPAGGVHWGDPAALATSNVLLKLLARQGLAVQPIEHYKEELSDNPVGQDYDVVTILNIVFPMHYPVTKVTVQPLPWNTSRPNMVFIGGSFVLKMMELLAASARFSELDYYFYYKMSQTSGADGELHQIAQPTPLLNFQTDVFASDALVLEANEEVLPGMAPHLQSFLHDALAALPGPRAAKAPFHYLSRTDYQWGDTLSFVANQHQIDTVAISGFSQLTASGACTEGPLAVVRLNVPPPTDDMELEVVAVPFLVDTRLTEQRVGVSANGQPLGEWVWTAGSPPSRQVFVPKELLTQGTLRLEFHLAHPAAPAEFGLSADPNKYGVTISSIRLHPEFRTYYRWGDKISFVAGRQPIDMAAISGFSPFSTEGAYTVGPVAVVRLNGPPANQDMVLAVDANAFIVDTRLPEQRVSISANGHPVGEWIWEAGTVASHALIIPKSLLGEGKLRLEFHVARPASPAEFGISSDTNPYGIRITSIWLHPAA